MLHFWDMTVGVPIESLTHALTSRTISARREVVQTQVTADRAKDACDALVEEIYHGTFLWLVHHINAATCQNYNPGKLTLINAILQDQYAVSSRNKTYATALL
jgi:myosin heavy subunit